MLRSHSSFLDILRYQDLAGQLKEELNKLKFNKSKSKSEGAAGADKEGKAPTKKGGDGKELSENESGDEGEVEEDALDANVVDSSPPSIFSLVSRMETMKNWERGCMRMDKSLCAIHDSWCVDKVVCDVSGNFLCAKDADERVAAHFAGRQYEGWKLIREKHKQLREKFGFGQNYRDDGNYRGGNMHGGGGRVGGGGGRGRGGYHGGNDRRYFDGGRGGGRYNNYNYGPPNRHQYGGSGNNSGRRGGRQW